MSRTLEECDAILDLACDCNAMSVVRTRWYGPNAGRRFRECAEEECGFHKWVDEEPSPRTLEIIKELLERDGKHLDHASRRRDRLVAWYEARLAAEKEKHTNTFVGLDLLCDVIKGMTLETQLPGDADPVYQESEDSD
ncbi:hypothetical protein DCAR_0207605 [Daucus carota subsp. sativus]|uniref:GRF-type domain-containing protein n=1 Tax=Daucus carota subsp. sativus TaxID=79200 RepID=A0AAF0WEB9_DAUCS|nr:PREDICTED: uncharacterized protein LOC108207618 [Daucus carota subsp. sativus]WOG88370.1 hypothetical protein DCAR_0207605 [Daucus carota subsp. sativus]